MTRPDERTRAATAARDFLTRLSSPYVEGGIKGIPRAVREEASRVLRHFPLAGDLYAAGEAAPEVFSAAAAARTIVQPPPAEEPDLSFMNADVLEVDPPSGWRYGFPKTWNRRTDPDMVTWLIKNGYPEKAARNPGLVLRFMAIPREASE